MNAPASSTDDGDDVGEGVGVGVPDEVGVGVLEGVGGGDAQMMS